MKHGSTRRRPTKKPIVVIAGEDSTDRKCFRILLETFCPEMRGRIAEISDSVRLRQATGKNLKERAKILSSKVKARAKREDAEVACVFIHEDFDAVDSVDYAAVHSKVQQALEEEFETAHYILAAWEIEAWLLLFPEGLTSLVNSWIVPVKYRNKDTGRLNDPKQLLKTISKSSPRAYRETDAPKIFEKIVERSLHTRPVGTNRSWERFHRDVQACCSSHIGTS